MAGINATCFLVFHTYVTVIMDEKCETLSINPCIYIRECLWNIHTKGGLIKVQISVTSFMNDPQALCIIFKYGSEHISANRFYLILIYLVLVVLLLLAPDDSANILAEGATGSAEGRSKWSLKATSGGSGRTARTFSRSGHGCEEVAWICCVEVAIGKGWMGCSRYIGFVSVSSSANSSSSSSEMTFT